MNLDELQSVQSRERQTDSLQQLRATFYEDAAEFVQDLRERRDEAAAAAEDPFDSPDVNRLTDDIRTAEQTVEAIYERRVGKVVKMASLAAADMPTEQEGLTKEERELFETMVDAIEAHREHILAVLGGDAPAGAVSSLPPDDGRDTEGAGATAEPTDATGTSNEAAADEPGTGNEPGAVNEPGMADEPGMVGATDEDGNDADGIDASAVMGDDTTGTDASDALEASTDETATDPSAESGRSSTGKTEPDGETARQSPRTDEKDGNGGNVGDAGGGEPTGEGESAGSADAVDAERVTVRITEDVGEIFGVDEREYDLAADDVVTLPATNADPLIERDAAERIE